MCQGRTSSGTSSWRVVTTQSKPMETWHKVDLTPKKQVRPVPTNSKRGHLEPSAQQKDCALAQQRDDQLYSGSKGVEGVLAQRGADKRNRPGGGREGKGMATQGRGEPMHKVQRDGVMQVKDKAGKLKGETVRKRRCVACF